MNVLAIDPGNEESAFAIFDDRERRLLAFQKLPNAELIEQIVPFRARASHMAIEMIASYGMPVGREVFETCVWIGRFVEAWGQSHTYVYRKDVKLHLCGQPRAKDGNIRQALIDMWGGKDKAIGKKATPGPLYGVSADVWSAVAVAVTFAERSNT